MAWMMSAVGNFGTHHTTQHSLARLLVVCQETAIVNIFLYYVITKQAEKMRCRSHQRSRLRCCDVRLYLSVHSHTEINARVYNVVESNVNQICSLILISMVFICFFISCP